jgi:hypothetical protein
MSSEKINYKIIDNLPQKKTEKLDVQMINQMIEGYDTVQNTLDDINSTNKYDLDFYKKKYIAFTDNDRYDSDNDMNYDDNNKKNQIVKSSTPNNKLNSINTFYVGSLTIVGLFIFYRMIQKTK